jgi:hypothetical protein
VNSPVIHRKKAVVQLLDGTALPVVIDEAGEKTARRFVEFFAATIRNKNTRIAYAFSVSRFLAWCNRRHLALREIDSLAVAAYVEVLGRTYSAPTVKQHVAAIRMCFDWMVSGGTLDVNPAWSVRGPKHVVKKGKTPVLDAAQARELLDSIDTTTIIGLRDRALIGVMVFSFARVGAVTRKAESTTRFPRITMPRRILMRTSRRPGSRAISKGRSFDQQPGERRCFPKGE